MAETTRESVTALLRTKAKNGGGIYLTADQVKALVLGKVQHVCPKCSREFTTSRGLGQHKPRCGKAGRPAKPLGEPTPENLAELRRLLERVAEEAGKPKGVAPSEYDLRRRSIDARKLARSVGERRYSKAVKLTGLKPAGAARHPTEKQAREELQRLSLQLGRGSLPSVAEYAELGTWGKSAVMGAVGVDNWNDLGPVLGLRVNTSASVRQPSPEDVLKDLHRVAEQHRPGYIPPTDVYRTEGRYHFSSAMNVLGVDSWNQLAPILGLKRNKQWRRTP